MAYGLEGFSRFGEGYLGSPTARDRIAVPNSHLLQINFRV